MSGDCLLGPAQIRSLAAELDLVPSKRHGQNFVIDPNTVRRIVRLAELSPGDGTLEVGPGLGSLTLGLLGACASVTAIEIEPSLAARLPRTVAEQLPAAVGRLTVVADDALRVPMPLPGPEPTALVANLPYNVSVPVLLRLLADVPSIGHGLVMVQSEVADRLVAREGSRVYGVPSVKMQWFGEVSRAGSVGPKVFWPEPRVESGLVRFVRHDPPASEVGRAEVFACIDAAFSQRRKALRSALADWAGGRMQSDAILAHAAVDPGLRGEALTLAAFVRIADSRAALQPT